MNADGSNPTPLTRITASGGDSTSPVWSPDGSKIAFESGRALDGSNAADAHGSSNIWVMNADGSNVTPLTRLSAGSRSQQPIWSPDGSKVAFPSNRALNGSDGINAATNIWLMNADGSNATPLTALTTGGANSFHPVWSPDGASIVFHSARALNGTDAINTNGTNNIWVIKADGSGATPLTQLTAQFASSVNAEWHP
jgi:Tol biopolymer transport system component